MYFLRIFSRFLTFISLVTISSCRHTDAHAHLIRCSGDSEDCLPRLNEVLPFPVCSGVTSQSGTGNLISGVIGQDTIHPRKRKPRTPVTVLPDDGEEVAHVQRKCGLCHFNPRILIMLTFQKRFTAAWFRLQLGQQSIMSEEEVCPHNLLSFFCFPFHLQ